MSEIKIILESSGESSLKDTLNDLRQYKELTDGIKANKESLVKAKDIGEIQKVTAELKKAELQLDSMKKKSIEQTEKENRKLQEQSGIIGQLVQKRKQLQGSLAGAKSVEEIRGINTEIQKTNAAILRLRNTGTGAFQGLERVLSSFQFKFNFLGNFVNSLVTGGFGLLTGAIGGAVASLIGFGQESENTAEETQELTDRIRDLIDETVRISEAEQQRRSQAEEDIEAVGFTTALSTKAQDDLNDSLSKEIELRKDQAEQQEKVNNAREGGLNQLKREVALLKEKNTDTQTERINKDRQVFELEQKIRKEELKNLQARSDALGEFAVGDLELQKEIADKKNEIAVAEAKFRAAIDAETFRKFKEDAEDTRNALQQLLQYRIQALQGRDEDERRISAEVIRIRMRLGTATREEIDALAKYEQDQIDKSTNAQIEAFKERQDAQDKFLAYRIKSLTGHDKEEQRIALESIRIRKRLGTATEEELDALDEFEKNRNKKRIKEFERTSNQVFEQIQKRIDAESQLLQDEISKQEQVIEAQRKLAERGLSNTLAFEEKRRAELDQRERDEQERMERIKKLEAYFNLFAEYSKEDPKTAAIKALRDVVVAEAISQAFAAEGGVVEDLAQPFAGGTIKNGVFVGKSHDQGGIHLIAEGEEGIFSKKEMANLGKENFYAIKDLLRNPINDDDFAKQEASFTRVVPIRTRADHAVVAAVEKLSEKFDQIPRIHQGIDNLDRIVESHIKNGLKRTILRPIRQI